MKKTGCVLISLTGSLGTLVGYPRERWEDYNRFLQTITVMLDYCECPEYEEVKDILDQYGVSDKEYTAFCRYVYMPECQHGVRGKAGCVCERDAWGEACFSGAAWVFNRCGLFDVEGCRR